MPTLAHEVFAVSIDQDRWGIFIHGSVFACLVDDTPNCQGLVSLALTVVILTLAQLFLNFLSGNTVARLKPQQVLDHNIQKITMLGMIVGLSRS